jgi:heptosyltransferase-3
VRAGAGKILVIRGGAIGDFILTLPAIRALRENFKEATLEVLGYPKVVELAKAAGLIHGFRSIEARSFAGFFARNNQLDKELSDYFASFAVIVSYLYDPDEILKDNIARVFKGQFIQGPHRPNEAQNIHATAVFLKPLEKLAIFETDPVPRIKLSGSGELSGKNWIAVHPGSGSEKKNWPEDLWLEFLKRVIRETSVQILLIGGEAEGDRLERFAHELPAQRTRRTDNLPLVELGRLMRQTNIFLGHDSGITHLASALDLPVIALWGPGNEAIWKPLGPKHRILKPKEGLGHLTVQEVFESFEEMRFGQAD